jgi:hypothetical protein
VPGGRAAALAAPGVGSQRPSKQALTGASRQHLAAAPAGRPTLKRPSAARKLESRAFQENFRLGVAFGENLDLTRHLQFRVETFP